MIEKMLEITFSGFWEFVGMWLLLGLFMQLALHFIFRMYNRALRSMNIKRHGWPPPHLDADGDLREIPTEQHEREL